MASRWIMLEIHGDIAQPERAESLEELLWSLIRRPGIYVRMSAPYDEGDREVSHPLALTQFLIAYHMVKAAAGRHDG